MKSLTYLSGLLIILSFISCTKDTPYEESSAQVIIDGNAANITQDTEWKDVCGGDSVDYFVETMVRVTGTAKLTIKPGVRISFESSKSGIRVEDHAVLNAVGTVNSNIVMSTRQDDGTPGLWKGIIFASDNASNVLDYVYISGAGSENDAGYCDSAASIGLANITQTKATITNCNINSSGGYALWVSGNDGVNLIFAKNYLSSENAPVACTAATMPKLDSLSNYFSLTHQYIDVYDGNGSEIKEDAIIQHLRYPYRISGTVYVSKTLTISRGCVFEFNKGAQLTTTDEVGINHTGVIKAIGTAGTKITFKGVEATKGYWVGITITSKAENELWHCDISDAGAIGAYVNPASARGNIIVGRTLMGASATIKYCNISNSAGYGIISFKDDATPSNSSTVHTTTISGMIIIITNTYIDNTLGNFGNYYQ